MMSSPPPSIAVTVAGSAARPLHDVEAPLLSPSSKPTRYAQHPSGGSGDADAHAAVSADAVHLTAVSSGSPTHAGSSDADGSDGGAHNKPDAVGLDDDFRDSHGGARPPTPHASVWDSALNLANTIIGIGILSVPAAISKLGLVVGVLMLALCAVGSSFGLYLLTLSSERLGSTTPSWFLLAKHTYPRLRYAIDLSICIKCIGVGTSFLLVVGQLLVPAFDGLLDPAPAALVDRRFWIALCGALTVPVACLPKMHHLRWSSVLGFGTIAYLLVVVVYEYADPNPATEAARADKTLEMAVFNARSVTAIPTFIFAYTCHQNAFTIYGELSERSVPRMKRVIGSAVGGSFSLYLFVGILGYLSFGQHVTSDILVDYGSVSTGVHGGGAHSVVVNICRLAMALHVCSCYPLQAHPFRTSFSNMLSEHFPVFRSRTDTDRRPHIFVTALFVAITFAVALSVDQLGLMFSLIGATGSNLMTYILPGAFYWKLTASDGLSNRTRVAAFCVMILGVIILVSALTIIILDHADKL